MLLAKLYIKNKLVQIFQEGMNKNQKNEVKRKTIAKRLFVDITSRLPEDSPHGRFATEDSPHNKCDREFERNRRTNVCNSADVEDSPHNGDRLGWGVGLGELGGLRLGGLKSGSMELGSVGWGQGFGVGGG